MTRCTCPSEYACREAMMHLAGCPVKLSFFGAPEHWGVGGPLEVRQHDNVLFEFDGVTWRPRLPVGPATVGSKRYRVPQVSGMYWWRKDCPDTHCRLGPCLVRLRRSDCGMRLCFDQDDGLGVLASVVGGQFVGPVPMPLEIATPVPHTDFVDFGDMLPSPRFEYLWYTPTLTRQHYACCYRWVVGKYSVVVYTGADGPFLYAKPFSDDGHVMLPDNATAAVDRLAMGCDWPIVAIYGRLATVTPSNYPKGELIHVEC